MDIKELLFKLLFRKDYEHMRHLIDDVIRLRSENARLRARLKPYGYIIDKYPSQERLRT